MVQDSGEHGYGTFFCMTDELLLHNGVVLERRHNQGHTNTAAIKACFLDVIFSFPHPLGSPKKNVVKTCIVVSRAGSALPGS